MKEEIIKREILKMKKKFKENNYEKKEIMSFLEAKKKIAKGLNDETLLTACEKLEKELS